ncbi:MAG: hypothetical protein J5I50_13870 [Chitinophagaceae bacterium]|nr:hypothetical protein [Chitinophagaceae bacterium]
MKTIVILSSEPWGKMMLSKMHFAIELARMGNKVFFVNPPRSGNQTACCVSENPEGYPSITIIHVKENPRRIVYREKFFSLFRIIENKYVRSVKKITGEVDELWCFNPQFIVNTGKFGAGTNLLFMYDFYRGKYLKKTASQSDAIISVAQNILDYFQDVDKPRLLLNHGLAPAFQQMAGESGEKTDDRIKIGYVGNLLRNAMDIGAFREIISSHPEIDFHIWGPAGLDENNVSGRDIPAETSDFIQFLGQQKNVVLHGVKTPEILAGEIQQADAFLFIYSAKKDINGASNSHKLMEYLSTGKTVFSTYVSHYDGTDLLVMDCKEGNNFPAFFDTEIKRLDEFNAPDRQKIRRSFALSNSYEQQIKKIYEFINAMK